MIFKHCDKNVNEWLCTLMFAFHDGVNDLNVSANEQHQGRRVGRISALRFGGRRRVV